MSVRRKTENRLTLYRECACCGQHIITTAETPWVRMVATVENGRRRQRIKYFCSSACFQASYKHIGWYDGKAAERRREKDRNEPPEEKAERWKRYYAANGEKVRQRSRERYYENHDAELADMAFYRQKRKLLRKEAQEIGN